ncbi:response regulator transcription factor [Flavobacterium chilense]|uniref:DNA-binding response regulator, NarL/FixJ family, contains REC and HTH domains n=1 Tax=Flavobacterium chilense TaxID=946677 RepID=A0A1M7G3Y1_9FLAO|nr:response regulator transcription factor [Flavobacterium chilense]SHM10993.1 DNA-binding response regulator, NarL/FixJ family, contains REC and HTH domains [Flavobacterium chilense]
MLKKAFRLGDMSLFLHILIIHKKESFILFFINQNLILVLKKKLNILIVDNHPIIISAYKKILQKKYSNFVHIDICDFYDLVIDKLKSKCFHAIFIDLELATSEKTFSNSIDFLCDTIKKKFPALKIILTMSENKSLLSNVLKCSYDAILIKRDIKKNIVLNSLSTVLTYQKFYSTTVLKLKSKIINPELPLDELDLKILQNLALGIRTKNLTRIIPLSLSAIEKRKNRIKTLLDADTNETLLKKARINGLI